ncbi:hypothetical protein LIER_42551 [Lithospermum erythrorhizon]|uniref:Uncharacterized protein n=1 Tax=Lithospermum erythrorhizon TaxID=34254 RepID=A0AAV3NHZ6_LITER
MELTISIITDNSSMDMKRNNFPRKRKQMPLTIRKNWDTESDSDDEMISKHNNSFRVSEASNESKIFSLLQQREKMLKLQTSSMIPNQQEGKLGGGIHVIHLLLLAAKAVNNVQQKGIGLAVRTLIDLFQSVSLKGDSIQRVAAYFADALVARLLTVESPFFDTIMKSPTAEEELFAFTELYKVSPFYQFAHFTANQAILEAFEDHNHLTLHVIDFDICYGFQWPSLIQSLSERSSPTNRVSLKITGFGRSLEELQVIEARLSSFAKGFRNLVFEFRGMLSQGCNNENNLEFLRLRRKKNETLAINIIFNPNMVRGSTRFINSMSSETLRVIHSLDPSIVTMVEKEGSSGRNGYQNFLGTLMESLHYYAAMFDSLDDCLPYGSIKRLSIEKNHLGKEIKDVIINCGDSDNKSETWKSRMERHGFEGIKLSSKCLIQAKLLLKLRSHGSPVYFGRENGGFRVFEKDDGKGISLGWQHRRLITISAWKVVNSV